MSSSNEAQPPSKKELLQRLQSNVPAPADRGSGRWKNLAKAGAGTFASVMLGWTALQGLNPRPNPVTIEGFCDSNHKFNIGIHGIVPDKDGTSIRFTNLPYKDSLIEIGTPTKPLQGDFYYNPQGYGEKLKDPINVEVLDRTIHHDSEIANASVLARATIPPIKCS